MSTKIYNGYRMPLITMRELLDKCLIVKKKIELIRSEIIRKRFDKELYSKDYLDLQQAANEVEKTKQRNPLVDNDGSIRDTILNAGEKRNAGTKLLVAEI